MKLKEIKIQTKMQVVVSLGPTPDFV